jgi:hypothetical protein
MYGSITLVGRDCYFEDMPCVPLMEASPLWIWIATSRSCTELGTHISQWKLFSNIFKTQRTMLMQVELPFGVAHQISVGYTNSFDRGSFMSAYHRWNDKEEGDNTWKGYHLHHYFHHLMIVSLPLPFRLQQH